MMLGGFCQSVGGGGGGGGRGEGWGAGGGGRERGRWVKQYTEAEKVSKRREKESSTSGEKVRCRNKEGKVSGCL